MARAAHSEGAPSPFAGLYASHAAAVWRTLRRLGVPPADIEDLCQEVFVILHRRLAELSDLGALRPWLFGVCARVASDHRRRAHVRREVPTAELPERPHVDGQVERRDALRALDRALSTLDDDKRAVFVLYEIEELTMAEVATAVGCPLQTAYSRLHAARSRVKEQMARGGPP